MRTSNQTATDHSTPNECSTRADSRCRRQRDEQVWLRRRVRYVSTLCKRNLIALPADGPHVGITDSVGEPVDASGINSSRSIALLLLKFHITNIRAALNIQFWIFVSVWRSDVHQTDSGGFCFDQPLMPDFGANHAVGHHTKLSPQRTHCINARGRLS